MVKLSERAHFVCTGNLDHLVMLDKDKEFLSAYRKADLVLADGAPVVWLSRIFPHKKGDVLQERVAGSDLFWELAKASHNLGIRLFFLGGMPGAAEKARESVLKRYPEAHICGSYCPPFESFNTDEEQANIREAICKAAPDILFVAFGAPKQEKWIAAYKDDCGVPVNIGVGGSFEMAGGMVHRAPVWMRRIGMEWAYRFVQEPGRLFNRYFVNDLPFLFKLSVRAVTMRMSARLVDVYSHK